MSAVFDPLRLSMVSLDVAAAHRGTPQGIAQRQQTRLAALIESALRGSRLYRSLWPAGTTPGTALEQLPMVTRAQLMADFDGWVTDPHLHFDALRAFTADRQPRVLRHSGPADQALLRVTWPTCKPCW